MICKTSNRILTKKIGKLWVTQCINVDATTKNGGHMQSLLFYDLDLRDYFRSHHRRHHTIHISPKVFFIIKSPHQFRTCCIVAHLCASLLFGEGREEGKGQYISKYIPITPQKIKCWSYTSRLPILFRHWGGSWHLHDTASICITWEVSFPCIVTKI